MKLKSLIASIGLILTSSFATADEVPQKKLSDLLNGLNMTEVYIEGALRINSFGEDWSFKDEKTEVYFSKPIMSVRPSNFRRLKEGCVSRSLWGDDVCTIKALAELDISSGRLNLIIFEILEANIPNEK